MPLCTLDALDLVSLVPPQTPELVNPLVVSYIEAEFSKLNSKNKLTVEYSVHGGKPWVADFNHWNFEAAKAATRVRRPEATHARKSINLISPFRLSQAVYKQEPDLTREGGSIPVTLTFAESLGVNVLLLPMGRGDDGAQ